MQQERPRPLIDAKEASPTLCDCGIGDCHEGSAPLDNSIPLAIAVIYMFCRGWPMGRIVIVNQISTWPKYRLEVGCTQGLTQNERYLFKSMGNGSSQPALEAAMGTQQEKAPKSCK